MRIEPEPGQDPARFRRAWRGRATSDPACGRGYFTLNVAAPSFQLTRLAQPGVNTPTFTVYVPAAAPAGTAQLALKLRVRLALNDWLSQAFWNVFVPSGA